MAGSDSLSTVPSRAASPYGGGRDSSANLADILERVLDKGIVIVGDIKINLLDIELLTIKLRLLVASVDKAKEIGIDWWEHDPALSSRADDRRLERGRRELEDERRDLEDENDRLRDELEELRRRARRTDAELPEAELSEAGAELPEGERSRGRTSAAREKSGPEKPRRRERRSSDGDTRD
ncbi:gas vesicle protein [Streptomyces sp. V3I7]|uniref:gas vesicle protein n=1 Tax=Streptomyces sp. V3I7 TaxID=3042278 RepID=UPI00277E026B|nr:gas vesicle protein [Streptomyces sp. V3I7]MDQ0994662.1 hypothetical protein [Streptomyces sp. V3I7]